MQHRLTEVHDRLGITPAQQPQWDALVGTLRDNAVAMRANPAVQAIRSGRLDAVQEMRAAADLARQRADAMQRTLPAVEALYAVLSPEQRQMADQEVNRMIASRSSPRLRRRAACRRGRRPLYSRASLPVGIGGPSCRT